MSDSSVHTSAQTAHTSAATGTDAEGQEEKQQESFQSAQDPIISSAISDINQEFKEKEVQQRARELGLSYIDLTMVPINPDNLQLISPEESKKGKMIVFFRVGQRLRIALVNPENTEAKQVINNLQNKGFTLNLNLCSQESLHKAQQMYETQYREKKEVIANVQEENEVSVQATISSLQELPALMKKMKSNEALNLLHQQALRMKVSDMHLEPQENGYRLRGRVDGLLSTFFELPAESSVSEMLIRQIKYNAKLKLNVTNTPQDGQYFFKTSDRLIDVRVSTLPTRRGESLVLRFLDPKRGIVALEELGISALATKRMEEMLQSQNGLILVTGPTGSGKTTTLYSALQYINAPEKKIVTLEDPVEYHLSGILQSQIDEQNGYRFATGLKSILRQDPDVVMVGEIRDLETAETAVQASLTGHLVLSTLHTNSALDAIPRFLNMGVKNYILAPALRMIVAQRLVRKVCEKCAEKRELSTSEKEEIFAALQSMSERGEKIPDVSAEILEGKGCEYCSDTGFRGMLAIAEVLIVDEELQNAIFENMPIQQLRKIAQKSGFRSMWEEGILAVIEGETTLAELRREVGR